MAVAVEFISQKTHVCNSNSRCQHYVPEHRPKSPVTASAQSRGTDSLPSWSGLWVQCRRAESEVRYRGLRTNQVESVHRDSACSVAEAPQEQTGLICADVIASLDANTSAHACDDAGVVVIFGQMMRSSPAALQRPGRTAGSNPRLQVQWRSGAAPAPSAPPAPICEHRPSPAASESRGLIRRCGVTAGPWPGRAGPAIASFPAAGSQRPWFILPNQAQDKRQTFQRKIINRLSISMFSPDQPTERYNIVDGSER